MPTDELTGMDEQRIAGQIDAAVTEVFDLMLQRACAPAACAAEPGLCACVRFSGAVEGGCEVTLSMTTAVRLTEALLGMDGAWDEAMVADAVGELCNMIAGGWKSRLGPVEAMCGMSVPAIPGGGGGGGGVRRGYVFEGGVFEVGLWVRS
jgi:chemotaxis protein CheX